ncbi:hypothetical protein [Pantoea sp. At-9b]|uniref:hypothetical protein n=1 Tax=Pantoea sp. (strain At-9b) TaxID=592316 RepID=UPI0001B3F4E7|nr:hypothetical protein [Pantoea sp. At-9b]ADU69443.1 TUBGCP6; tubulin, gamma complex associated protein 6 [Pantoea sp. At-9b]
MTNELAQFEDIKAELKDLRLEVAAQQTVIHVLLSFLEGIHGQEKRRLISEAIKNENTGPLIELLDEEAKQRLLAIQKKLQHFI